MQNLATIILESVSDIKYEKRMRDFFELIFRNYKYSNIHYGDNKRLFLGPIIYDFVDLLLKSPGEIQIATDVIYFFENKKFFISMSHMLESEIVNVLKLIDILPLMERCKHLRMYETKSVSYTVPVKARVNLLYGFLRFIAQLIFECFPGNSEAKIIKQYKIRLCKLFIDISKVLEYRYKLNLSRNINIFRSIIKSLLNFDY